MQIEFDDTAYTLKFGIGLIKELNKKYHIEKDGMSFGTGLQRALGGIYSGDIIALIELVSIANRTETPRFTQAALEKALDDGQIDVEKLFDDVMNAVKESNVTKFTAKKFQKKMDEEQKKQE